MKKTLEMIDSLEGNVVESQVAKTIYQQFGGKRAMFMIGGKATTIKGGKGIGIKWPNKQRKKGNYVEIILKGDDTYDMEFFNLTMKAKKSVKKHTGVYADQLRSLFEKQTGWYLKL